MAQHRRRQARDDEPAPQFAKLHYALSSRVDMDVPRKMLLSILIDQQRQYGFSCRSWAWIAKSYGYGRGALRQGRQPKAETARRNVRRLFDKMREEFPGLLMVRPRGDHEANVIVVNLCALDPHGNPDPEQRDAMQRLIEELYARFGAPHLPDVGGPTPIGARPAAPPLTTGTDATDGTRAGPACDAFNAHNVRDIISGDAPNPPPGEEIKNEGPSIRGRLRSCDETTPGHRRTTPGGGGACAPPSGGACAPPEGAQAPSPGGALAPPNQSYLSRETNQSVTPPAAPEGGGVTPAGPSEGGRTPAPPAAVAWSVWDAPAACRHLPPAAIVVEAFRTRVITHVIDRYGRRHRIAEAWATGDGALGITVEPPGGGGLETFVLERHRIPGTKFGRTPRET